MIADEKPSWGALYEENKILRRREQARTSSIADLNELLGMARQEKARADATAESHYAQAQQAGADLQKVLDAAKALQVARDLSDALVESLTADVDTLAANLETVNRRLAGRVAYTEHLTRDLARAQLDVENLQRQSAGERARHAVEVQDLRARVGAGWWARLMP